MKINRYKDENYHDLVTPRHAFVIFEYENAKLVAERKHFTKAFTLLGQTVKISRAQNPSTVIWENYQLPNYRRYWRIFGVSLLLFCLYFSALSLIMYAT
jgi:hypothetical protein